MLNNTEAVPCYGVVEAGDYIVATVNPTEQSIVRNHAPQVLLKTVCYITQAFDILLR